MLRLASQPQRLVILTDDCDIIILADDCDTVILTDDCDDECGGVVQAPGAGSEPASVAYAPHCKRVQGIIPYMCTMVRRPILCNGQTAPEAAPVVRNNSSAERVRTD